MVAKRIRKSDFEFAVIRDLSSLPINSATEYGEPIRCERTSFGCHAIRTLCFGNTDENDSKCELKTVVTCGKMQ
jgi:hypothetical protein